MHRRIEGSSEPVAAGQVHAEVVNAQLGPTHIQLIRQPDGGITVNLHNPDATYQTPPHVEFSGVALVPTPRGPIPVIIFTMPPRLVPQMVARMFHEMPKATIANDPVVSTALSEAKAAHDEGGA